jgi:hypothetical protein
VINIPGNIGVFQYLSAFANEIFIGLLYYVSPMSRFQKPARIALTRAYSLAPRVIRSALPKPGVIGRMGRFEN